MSTPIVTILLLISILALVAGCGGKDSAPSAQVPDLSNIAWGITASQSEIEILNAQVGCGSFCCELVFRSKNLTDRTVDVRISVYLLDEFDARIETAIGVELAVPPYGIFELMMPFTEAERVRTFQLYEIGVW